jgi:hypothetical protein
MLDHIKQIGFNARIDYDGWSGPKAVKLNRQCLAQDFTGLDLIYGHFPISRYDRAGHRYVALVRDPIERVRSSYDFHRDHAQTHPDCPEFYSRIGRWIGRGELSFIEYLHIAPNMRNVYRIF